MELELLEIPGNGVRVGERSTLFLETHLHCVASML